MKDGQEHSCIQTRATELWRDMRSKPATLKQYTKYARKMRSLLTKPAWQHINPSKSKNIKVIPEPSKAALTGYEQQARLESHLLKSKLTAL
jgi:hypothetical protein